MKGKVGLGLLVAGLAIATLFAEEKAPAPADAAASLERRIAELERENRELKAKVKDLEALLPIQRMLLNPGKLPPIIDLDPLQKEQAPKGSVPRQFNGETFYVVPLQK